MANFKTAFIVTSGHEGGYANDPADSGGETYKGISRNNFPNWAGWKIIDLVKKQIGFVHTAVSIDKLNHVLASDLHVEDLVEGFFKVNFWDVNKLDFVTSQAIANELYDTGVNMGTGVAARFLQEALNLCNKNGKLYANITVDGKIGNQTLNTLLKAPQSAVLCTLNLLQGEKYLNIMRNKETQEKFWQSWLSRVFVTGKWI